MEFNEFMGIEYPREQGDFTPEEREISKQLIQNFIKSMNTEQRSDLILLSIKKVAKPRDKRFRMDLYRGNNQTYVYFDESLL